jgi:hypothetical protein
MAEMIDFVHNKFFEICSAINDLRGRPGVFSSPFVFLLFSRRPSERRFFMTRSTES